MTSAAAAALFFAMLVLAVVPGPGVIVVAARSMAFGFRHGMITTLGIVCGDFVFIILAVYGLQAMAQAMGVVFIALKYLGAFYLVWLGIKILLTRFESLEVQAAGEASYLANFLVGLATTLGNPKAILFYLSFFPAFLDLPSLVLFDISMILLITTVAVGGVMLMYAYLAAKTRALFYTHTVNKSVALLSGGALVGSGAFLALKT